MEIIVTVNGGKTKRRYVVEPEDQHLFEGVAEPEELTERYGKMGCIVRGFGARWLRGPGRLDEMYRTLSLSDVLKIARKEQI